MAYCCGALWTLETRFDFFYGRHQKKKHTLLFEIFSRSRRSVCFVSQRIWAQFSRRDHSGAAPAVDKGRLVIPEMQTYLQMLRQLAEFLKTNGNSGDSDALKMMNGPSTDQGKPWMSGPSPSALTVAVEKGSTVSYKMATNGIRALGQKGGNRQHKKSAGGFLSTSTRVPRSVVQLWERHWGRSKTADDVSSKRLVSRDTVVETSRRDLLIPMTRTLHPKKLFAHVVSSPPLYCPSGHR